jgi:hypothetical protein
MHPQKSSSFDYFQDIICFSLHTAILWASHFLDCLRKSPLVTPDSRLNQVSVFGTRSEVSPPLAGKNQSPKTGDATVRDTSHRYRLGSPNSPQNICGHDPCSLRPERRPATYSRLTTCYLVVASNGRTFHRPCTATLLLRQP